MKKQKENQRGRSMIEMMGYIAVVMTLTVSIGYIISKAYGDYKYSKASLQLTDLANSITKAGAIEANYADIVTMINTKDNKEGFNMIPSTYRVKDSEGGRTIHHAFGGSVTIGHPGSDTTKFAVTFNNLSRNQCIELAMKDWMHNKYIDLFSITVNGTQWNWPAYQTVNSGDYVLPIKRSEVAGTGVGSEGVCTDLISNSIMWVFN